MTSLNESMENISEREDFCSFVEALRHDLLNNRDQWENIALSDFLEAMQAWVEDMDGYYIAKELKHQYNHLGEYLVKF